MKRTNKIDKDVKLEKPYAKVNPKVALDNISLVLLNSQKVQYSEIEMEAKFGTRGIKSLTNNHLYYLIH